MGQLQGLWQIVVEVWTQSIFGVSVGDLLLGLSVFALFYWLRHLLTRFIMNALQRLSRRTTIEFDDKIIDAVSNPIRFVPIVMGVYFGFLAAGVSVVQKSFGGNVVQSLVAVTIFWALYNAITPLSAILYRLDRFLTREMIDWAVKTLKVLVIFLAGVAVFSSWGINVGAALAGLGLFGVAVALGAQDLFKNLIAGLLILSEKRFHKGDWILVSGIVEGTVEFIGFRSTRVRRFDKAPVHVPNAQLSDSPVTNFSEMTFRRIKWVIGVEYSTTVAQLREIRNGIEGYILNNEDFVGPSEAATFVHIDSFNDSSIDILLYCFTRTTVWGEWLQIKEELACKVKEIVEGAGTGFAFPSRSLYLETIPGEAAEIFVPPSGRSGGAAAKTGGKTRRTQSKPAAKTRGKTRAKETAKA
ncbi:MAG: mechanosensitive ion channel family protein [Alphaproteobacteria bacterium]